MIGSRFDYDVIVIGSGFGGSVATLRATEKGYRVGVMELGRRWPDSAILDIATGAVLRGPAQLPLVTYEVRERNGEIEVRI